MDKTTKTLMINPKFKELIPQLTLEEYSQLRANIAANGCQDSIKTWQDQIVDGHNRYNICRALQMSYPVKEMSFKSEAEAQVWIITNQFGRRNISMFTKAELALKLEPLIAEQAKVNQIERKGKQAGSTLLNSEKLPTIHTGKELAKLAKVSPDTIAKTKFLLANADDVTKERLRIGKTTVHKEFTAIKRQAVIAKLAQTAKVTPPTIDGKFDVIVVDPPWPVEKIERDVRPNQTLLDYPTMTLEKIRAFQLPTEKANDNCHLFCWTTEKFLPVTFDIIAGWGFEYIFMMVWHKNGGFQPFNLPQYNAEFCVYARKGTPIFLTTTAFNICNAWRRGEHSQKPDEFYELVRRVTVGRRLEIFNRRKIEGFIGWGNEAK